MTQDTVDASYDPRLKEEIEKAPFPLLFATISGAHLYGFPSLDSDYDLRGVHVLTDRELYGLDEGEETIVKTSKNPSDGFELDLVTHDAKKFFLMMLKKNGYVLEQLYSPLVLHTTPEHAELQDIAKKCITRFHAHHYLGFSETQWRLFVDEERPRAKPLLYVFRVLLTGIHLMQTGEIEANLLTLNQEFNLEYIPDLIDRKKSEGEQVYLDDAIIEQYQAEYFRLRIELEKARNKSKLPESPSAKSELNDLLIRIRFKYATTNK